MVVWEGGHCVCGRQRKACTCGGIASGGGGGGRGRCDGPRWESVVGCPGRGPQAGGGMGVGGSGEGGGGIVVGGDRLHLRLSSGRCAG